MAKVPPPTTATKSDVSLSKSDDPPKLSFMGNDFPLIQAPGGEFQINSKGHHLPVGEMSENNMYVASCRPVQFTLAHYMETNSIEARVLTHPNGKTTVRRFTKSLIQGIIVALSSLLDQGLGPADASDTESYVIFPERFVPNSYRFMNGNHNSFFDALKNQIQYNPCVEVCIINSRRLDGPEFEHIQALCHLIFSQILENQANLVPEWTDLHNRLESLYVASVSNLSTEEEWKCCEAHGVFMSWMEEKNVIEKLYNWRFHSDNNVFLQTLASEALTTVPELRHFLSDWVNTIRAKGGPLLKILNYRSGSRAYKANNVDDFVMFLRNASVHVCDKDLVTGNYKNINMTHRKEKHYAKEGYVYLMLTRFFPGLFIKLNEFLIRKNAPPY